MISLTVENARELLEAGEVYRLGYNCANRGEMFLCFDRIAQCPQSLENLERIEDEYRKNPNGRYSLESLELSREHLAGDKLFGFFGFTMEELLDAVGTNHHGYCAYEFDGKFCSGSGAEPLWILEDGETCEDIREDDVDYGPFDDEDEWE